MISGGVFTGLVIVASIVGGWVVWHVDRWQRTRDARETAAAKAWMEPAGHRVHQFGPADELSQPPVAPDEYGLIAHLRAVSEPSCRCGHHRGSHGNGYSSLSCMWCGCAQYQPLEET